MTIVLCGGGSGGHITPLVAVAAEIRERNPDARLVYIGERHGKFVHIAADSKLFDELHYIRAGKLRRYHGESVFTKLIDVRTILLNFIDLFKMAAGTIQSYFLLRKIKADSMLLKGGFVCVPVALAGRLTGVPYVTHDSDALPGLSNRIAARWARLHATAMPAKYYSYPQHLVRVVGVPSDSRFRPYSPSEQNDLRKKFGIANEANVLLVTGGSNGARRLNTAVIDILPKLLSAYPALHVLHQIGTGNEDQVSEIAERYKERVQFFGFSNEIFHMSAIADVIIARAGASAIADYANQGKACVIVPNPYLTGGHQLKNAKVYEDASAAMVVQESALADSPDKLFTAVSDLLTNAPNRRQLADNLSALNPAVSPAASLADILYEIAK